MSYTKKELKQIELDRDYWDELVHLLGWRLIGFTWRASAIYDTGGKLHKSLQINSEIRDQIVEAIKKTK